VRASEAVDEDILALGEATIDNITSRAAAASASLA